MDRPQTFLEWEGVHPLLARWFYRRFKGPTEIQKLAWPHIAAGGHVLLTAPTGTGKTLAVFLIALNRLLQNTGASSQTKVVYISPLKALNNDIRENLTQPLSELKSLFEQEGEPFPDIRALTRSGDTPQSERQRMLRKPPDILITTPESLNLLLSSPKARNVLKTVETVILDEIHAVAAGKRGTHLITAVERLTLLAGEFQRIGVSATIRPLSAIADFIGGYRMRSGTDGPVYEKRPVEVIKASGSKRIHLEVKYPVREARVGVKETVWEQIAGPVREIIKNRSSTLVFVNSRRLAENLTHIINEGGELIAYAHHGSLSREIRHIVEKRLKAGDLSAIVATASLEMGIDIGDLDQVILIQTPFSVSQAVQRIGRAGHSVSETSAGVLYPSFGMDLVRAAVIAGLVIGNDVEEVKPVSRPLDVLSQVLISMLGISQWNLRELFYFLRCSAPFHDLAEREYRAVLEMLAGRYRDTRIRELHPRINIDRVTDTAIARKGALLLLYSSGGTIPDLGYFSLRIQGSQAKIGELDEEFVWERKTGDTFSLGTQSWKVTKIDHQKVEVVPWRGPVKIQPFWKGDSAARDFHFSEKILEFLEYVSGRRDNPDCIEELKKHHFLDEEAAEALLTFLSRQVASSGAELPHRHHILVEHSADPSTGGELCRTFIHTLWGNRLNYPLSLVLGALCDRRHLQVEIMSDNDIVMMQTPADDMFDDEFSADRFSVVELLSAIDLNEIDDLIRRRLEHGGYFGSRFRENAGRALLLPRSRAGKRTPLWVNRAKAKRLMDAVRGYGDFPILIETWRTCIQDEFDLDSLKDLIGEIQTGLIKISEVHTGKPSPFADGAIWQATNDQLYGDDTPPGTADISVNESLLREAVFSANLRPDIEAGDLAVFLGKIQRTQPGYAPSGSGDLIGWVDERLLIPVSEWKTLLHAVFEDTGVGPDESAAGVSSRCLFVRLPGGETECVASVYGLSLLCEAFDFYVSDLETRALTGGVHEQLAVTVENLLTERENDDAGGPVALESFLLQWLGYYGPVLTGVVSSIFGETSIDVKDALLRLAEEKRVVLGYLSTDAAEEEICDADNLEKLLAFGRRRRRSGFEPQPACRLISFLPRWQQIGRSGTGPEALKKILSPLFCYPLPAAVWEENIIPSRLPDYQTGWLDELLRTTDLEWVGSGEGRLAFCFPEDLELFDERAGGRADGWDNGRDAAADPAGESAGRDAKENRQPAPGELFPDKLGRYTFWSLKDKSGLGSADFSELLWRFVWKGIVRCDTFEPVRNRVLHGMKTPERPAGTAGKNLRTRRRSAGIAQWKISRPIAGNWYLGSDYVSGEGADRDPLDEIELDRDRVRLLLSRYGVVFRELLTREAEPLRWRRLFRTMRLMELSGEIIGGYFFKGVQSLQFALPSAVAALREQKPADDVFVLNAADPASLCGVDIPDLKQILPERFASTYLVCHGGRVVIVARKRAQELEIAVKPDDPDLERYIDALFTMTRRSFNPMNAIRVKRINGKEAAESGYDAVFEQRGFVRDYQGYTGWSL